MTKNLIQIGAEQKRSASSPGREFLVFSLAEGEYAVDILQVQEIRRYDTVTRIATAPDFVKGMINLRGVIVPILDLRIKFGRDNPTYDDHTVVIVLNLSKRIIGIVVDGVSDVATLHPDQIKPVPETQSLDARYVMGLGVIGDRMVILADIEKLLAGSGMEIHKLAA